MDARQGDELYLFEGFRLDPVERRLTRGDDVSISLQPRTFDLLVALVRRAGRVVAKEDLLREVWQESFVEEGSLTVNISMLRRALGEGQNGQKFIETVPKRGYRFAAPVSANTVSGGASPTAGLQVAISEGQNPAIVTSHPSTSAEFTTAVAPNTESAGRGRYAIVGALLLATLVASGLIAHKSFTTDRPATLARPLPALRRMTHTGRALSAAISPDGQFIAYALEEGGRQSLWLRPVADGDAVRLTEPNLDDHFGVAFSPDAAHIYYGIYPPGSLDGILMRVSVNDGTPARLLVGIDSAVTFAPDHNRIAFLHVAGQATRVVTADADGRDVRTLAVRTHPLFFSHDGQPTWSPDGKWIAITGGTLAGGRRMHVLLFNVENATERTLTAEPWADIQQLYWLDGDRGLVMTAAKEAEAAHQLWRISHPAGQVEPVTKDYNGYYGISVTQDALQLVTIERERIANLWTVGAEEQGTTDAAEKQITDGTNDTYAVAWMPGGRIVYGSESSGNADLWIISADGKEARQLTRDPSLDDQPTVTADGRSIIFVSKRAGNYNLWQMDAEGGNLRRLTNGLGEFRPDYSPDGKWVAFHKLTEDTVTSIWKLRLDAVDNEAPIQLTDKPTTWASVSPDGTFIASTYRERQEAKLKIGIFHSAGGTPIRILTPLEGARLPGRIRWTRDGKGLLYAVTADGADNIWRQSVDDLEAKSPQQLTRFRSQRIYSFDLSPDGKRFAIVRGETISRVVLIENFL